MSQARVFMPSSENKMSDGHRGRVWREVEKCERRETRTHGGWPFAYVRGVEGVESLGDGLRGRSWFSYFRSAESWPVRHRPGLGALDGEQTC
jgi:hypothetical protein